MRKNVKVSFRTRIITMFLAAIIGCMAVMIIGCNLFLRPLFINDSKKSMKRYGAEVCAALESGAEQDEIKSLLDRINNAYMIQTVILSEDKHLLYNENGDGTQNLSKGMEHTIEWLREEESSKKEAYEMPFFKERYDNNYQIKRLFYVQQTSDQKYVIMNKAIKGIEQNIQLVSLFITIMGITVAVIGAISCSFLTRPFTSQMDKISRITHNMSNLNFDEKINYHSQDEIGVLSDSIDEMSEHLKQSIETLQRDLESRKHLVRNLSHELKTPITTIRGYAENTQIVAAENERVQKYCRIMIEECDEMDSLIGEMLEMSRLECGDPYEKSQVNTQALFDRIIQKNRIQFPDSQIQYRTDACQIYGNAQLLERAVQNYIQNAVKYGKKDGMIAVEGKMIDRVYMISVTNEGKTIPQEELDNLWDVFYKADKSRKRNKSHGIGLAIVQQIAMILNGGVDVVSRDGKTTFRIWVPDEEKQEQNNI